MNWRQHAKGGASHLDVGDVKICDLCGGLNLASNKECFLCGWSGHFERKPEVLRHAVELLERRHGRLTPEMLSNPAPAKEAGRLGRWTVRGLLTRLRAWFFD